MEKCATLFYLVKDLLWSIASMNSEIGCQKSQFLQRDGRALKRRDDYDELFRFLLYHNLESQTCWGLWGLR
jgi:hypothetical protein